MAIITVLYHKNGIGYHDEFDKHNLIETHQEVYQSEEEVSEDRTMFLDQYRTMFLDQYFEKYNDDSTNPLSYENNPNCQEKLRNIPVGHTGASITWGDIIKIEFPDKIEYWVRNMLVWKEI